MKSEAKPSHNSTDLLQTLNHTDFICEDRKVNFKRKKYKAFCDSQFCGLVKVFRDRSNKKHQYSYNESIINKVEITEAKKTDIFCPRCKSALEWKAM